MSSKHFLIYLFVLAVVTRFIKLDWGSSFFFHPDENNMATAISQLSWPDMNPHFFSYGQFPLYLGFILLKVFSLPQNFSNSVLVLRSISAVCSIIYLFILYRLSFYLFNSKKLHLVFLTLLIFTPGLIQLSHFGTTESLLNLIFALELLLAFRINQKPSLKINYFLTALFLGIGLATKISAILFFIPFLIVNRSILCLIFVSGFSFLISIILSPYNFLELSNFLSSMRYETAVATGKLLVFYTQQFIGSTPYIFQLIKIFPYSSGLLMFIFGLIGFFFIKINRKTLIIILPCLVYFIYFGQVFVKWSRFMSPLFFIFPLLTTLLISKIKNSFLNKLILIISIIPGILFLKLYLKLDTRIQASDWINQNVPAHSTVLSESGNVINLPVNNNNLNINNFDFYNYQSEDLINQVNQSDYIFIPSRRVFKNNFATDYYRNLFNGNLDFSEIKKFVPNCDFLLNSENAEETWSVFDHPTIRIFNKNEN